MDCRSYRTLQLQSLERGVLSLWDEIAQAKADAYINRRNERTVNNLLSKVDQLAILVMELNDVEQKCLCSNTSIVFVDVGRKQQNPCQAPVPTPCPAPVPCPIQAPCPAPELAPCRASVANCGPLPVQSPLVEDYPDVAVMIASVLLIFLAIQIFLYMVYTILDIFRRHC